jgi:hypothetical protein
MSNSCGGEPLAVMRASDLWGSLPSSANCASLSRELRLPPASRELSFGAKHIRFSNCVDGCGFKGNSLFVPILRKTLPAIPVSERERVLFFDK